MRGTGARAPLRVLFVVPDLAVGGAERHVVTLLPRLDPTRFTPMVVCIGEEGPLFAGLRATGVPAVALHRTRREAATALVELRRVMRRFAPDLVVLRGYNAEGLGRVASVLARVPRTVVWVHNHGDTEPRGRLRRVVDRLLDRVTDAYFGVAHAQVEYLTGELGHPRDKIRIIHNGVDVAGFDPDATPDQRLAAELGIEPHHRVVGIVAALRPEKDHALVLRVARRLADTVPDVRLLVVGDGPERARIEKQVAELGLAEHVVLAGSRPDVPALLRLMDVMTLASYSVECFPMAVLEAMAAGVPVVATAVGGVPEMVADGETGFLVGPHDERALGDRLLHLLTEPATARAFGAAARRRVEREFTLDRSVARAQDELEAVGRGGRPVGVTVVVDLTFVGGAEMVLLDTLRHLDPTAARVRLVCLREEGPLAGDFRAAGVPVEVVARTGRGDTRLPRLVRTLRRDGTDVVLVMHHHRAALVLGRLAALLAGARSVVAAHDMDLTRVGRRCLPRSTVETLRASAALVLLSPSQGTYLHREEGVGRFPWSRTREVVIRNGIDVPPQVPAADRAAARAELGLADHEIAVGIVARLTHQKAHEVLFAAVARLADPRVRLVVVGDGPRRAELESLAAELRITDRTTFTGLRRDVPRLLGALDVACLSSVHEGVPLIVIEAMAAGLPVVATDCGALRDLVADGENGYLVPVGDEAALAARLELLVADPALRARLGATGRDTAVRDHHVRGTAAAYADLFTSVARRR